ncbi:MAG: hypothetical protein IH946_10695, partial [Bacteroidetes bacterium]|nr:hypothetical protein [Bacteroidota bacterium]
MLETQNAQTLLFQQIKDRLPENISMVEEIAELLNISTDSAYRRIRGDKPIVLDELIQLKSHFNIALDDSLQGDSNTVTFSYTPLGEEGFSYTEYLRAILTDLKVLDAAEEKDVIYIANDIPLFHLLNVPEIAAFKNFFWRKELLGFSDMKGKDFILGAKDDEINQISGELREIYLRIPSTEIINAETVASTLKQIEY